MLCLFEQSKKILLPPNVEKMPAVLFLRDSPKCYPCSGTYSDRQNEDDNDAAYQVQVCEEDRGPPFSGKTVTRSEFTTHYLSQAAVSSNVQNGTGRLFGVFN